MLTMAAEIWNKGQCSTATQSPAVRTHAATTTILLCRIMVGACVAMRMAPKISTAWLLTQTVETLVLVTPQDTVVDHGAMRCTKPKAARSVPGVWMAQQAGVCSSRSRVWLHQ